MPREAGLPGVGLLRASGCSPGVGLLSGGIAGEQLRSAGAVAVYADPAALLDDLKGSPIGHL
jgi:hypothetical protein